MKILSYLIAFLLPMGLAAQISTFPYTEDFQGALIPATDLPAGWAESGLATDSIWNTGDAATASSAFFTFPANTLFAYTNDDDCNCDKSEDRLITPVFDFTGLTGAQIDFDYFTGTSGSDFVEIEISTDSGATFTPIDTLAKVASWTNIIIDLSAYTGVGFDKVAVSIKYNDNGIWGYGVGVDNIIVGAPPACPIPTALNTAGLSFNSADVAWTENGTATQWQIEYDTAGFTQGTGTRVIANSNPFSITGLSAETDYEWYVRAICGPADTSLWSAQGSFTTLCAPILAPWTDDVELHNPTTSLSTSLCWTATANNGTNDWNIDGAGSTPSTGTGPAAANSGTNYFYFEASGGTAGNEAYLQTPLIDLTPLTVPQLSFFYHMYGAQNGVMADLYVDV